MLTDGDELGCTPNETILLNGADGLLQSLHIGFVYGREDSGEYCKHASMSERRLTIPWLDIYSAQVDRHYVATHPETLERRRDEPNVTTD
jgi:hypothetical protein